MLKIPGLKGPLAILAGGNVLGTPGLGQELVTLAVLRTGNTTGIKESLQAAITPRGHNIVGNGAGSIDNGGRGGGVSAGNTSSSSSVHGSNRGGEGITSKLSLVLTSEGEELIAFAILRVVNAVLVQPLLQLAIRPSLEGLLSDLVPCILPLERSLTGVAADGSNKLITVVPLRNRVAVLITPLLQIASRPLGIDPVTRVLGSLTSLGGNSLIVATSSGEKSITVPRLRARDVVIVKKRLELRSSPTIAE